MLRVIVNVLLPIDTAVTSTISSTAVSGLITTVKVSPDEIVAPPRRADAETTVADEEPDVRVPVRVVC